jgi:hypothetical protein
MTEANAQYARLLPQRTLGSLHHFRELGYWCSHFRVCPKQFYIVLTILSARSLLRHLYVLQIDWKGALVSLPNLLIKRTDVTARPTRRHLEPRPARVRLDESARRWRAFDDVKKLMGHTARSETTAKVYDRAKLEAHRRIATARKAVRSTD